MTLVVDASAACELLLNRPAATEIAECLTAHAFDLHAPHLLETEVLHALRQLVIRHDADPARATQALEDLHGLGIERYSPAPFSKRVWGLRENFSAYDATYVALAEAFEQNGATLLTCDARLARAVQRHTGLTVVCAA